MEAGSDHMMDVSRVKRKERHEKVAAKDKRLATKTINMLIGRGEIIFAKY